MVSGTGWGLRRRRWTRRAAVATTVVLVALASPVAPDAPVDAAVVSRTLLAFGSTGWKLLDNGTDPGPGWRMSSFDPTPWRAASLPVGTGAGVATTSSTAGTTQYLTRTFSASLAGVKLVRLRMRRDDGAIVYLNGRPVARSNVPFGEATAATQAWAPTTAARFDDESVWLPREMLNEGTNRISVELHQASPNDDVYLDLELTGVSDAADVIAPAAPPARISEVTSSSIRMAWTAPADAGGIVAYRIRRGNATLVVAQATWGLSYLDQQLAPGATYSYSVSAIDAAGNESPSSVVSATTTLPAGTPVVRLQAAGDIGVGTAAQKMLSTAGAEPADAFLALGDLSYSGPGSEPSWCQFVRSRLNFRKVQVIGGNHEDDRGTGGHISNFAPCFTDRIVSGGTYPTNYYADFGSLVRFIGISPGLWIGGRYYDYYPVNQERQWLIDTIAAGRAQNRWIIVGMHKPCVSVGEKPCEVRPDLMDVLSRADLVLSGHDHIYERTHQFGLQSGCTTFTASWANPRCVTGDGFGGTYTAGRGVVQVVSGVGGESINTVDAADPLMPYVVVANGANSWSPATGYLRLAVTPNAIAGEFRATTGRFGDSFTIRRP